MKNGVLVEFWGVSDIFLPYILWRSRPKEVRNELLFRSWAPNLNVALRRFRGGGVHVAPGIANPGVVQAASTPDGNVVFLREHGQRATWSFDESGTLVARAYKPRASSKFPEEALTLFTRV